MDPNWNQRYEYGKVVSKLKSTGKTKKNGTKITFKPDIEIFKPVAKYIKVDMILNLNSIINTYVID